MSGAFAIALNGPNLRRLLVLCVQLGLATVHELSLRTNVLLLSRQ